MLKKIALFTALALLLAMLPLAAVAEEDALVLTLAALESGGTIGKLSDFPTLDMRIEITLYEDGLFWMDFYNKGEESNSMGLWEQTRSGFELYPDGGKTWSLVKESHGYYALEGDSVNMLFEAKAVSASASQAARVDANLAPANIAMFTAPFAGDADDHVNAADYVALNQAVHQAVWQAAGNHQLTKYLLELWNGPSVGHGENAAEHHYQASTPEHIDILESIRDRRPEDARKAMAGHIRRSMENMLAHYPEA